MKLLFSFAHKIKTQLLMQKMGFVVAFYISCLIPTIFLIVLAAHKKESFEEMQGEVDCLAIRMERVKELQKDRSVFFKEYGEVDPYFVDHAIEPMLFLTSEIEALRLVTSNPAFESCDTFKKRLDKLTKGGNRFIFSEGNRRIGNQVEEVELIQKRPVEINVHDLRNVLTVIEGVSIGEDEPHPNRPQFVVRRFLLNKKKLAERETYQLEMQLIKRGTVK